jgi:carbonic anhydrase
MASPNAVSAKWSLHSLLDHNHRFVTNKSYEPYLTDRFPYKKLVVVTCMDTRLTELLPMALDLKNGDAKIIKVAGAMVAHPFGSVMRSILVAVYGLGAEHILVVGHHDWSDTAHMNTARRHRTSSMFVQASAHVSCRALFLSRLFLLAVV